jgi:ATP-binding cassette subfamily C protein CydC
LAAGVVIPFFIRALSQDAGSQRVKAKARMHILVLDILQGMPELLVFGQSEKILQKFKGTQNVLNQADRKLAKASGFANALMGVAMNVGMWCVLVLGIVLIEKGQLNGLYLGMLALGVLSSFEAVNPIPTSLQQLEENQAAGKRLRLTTQGKGNLGKDKDRGHDFGTLQRGEVNKLRLPLPEKLGIEFREVSFRYNQEEPWALKDVSLNIPYQKKVGIVGKSGAGKSSLVNLLLRFWDYEQGEICLGGLNIKDFDVDDVRAQFGVVTQRTHLFHATVKENLLLAKPEATDEELYEAAKRAKIHDFILSLPQGYDSLIGEEGMKLSGGQQQRLAIARVLLKNAPILILDEATNGLDPVTERDVYEEISSLMQGRTTLVISHHLGVIKDMDEIYVLDQGNVMESGQHEVLLSQEGYYRRLWEGQWSNLR